MTDPSIPPPSYQLSQRGHDHKITEKLLGELILSKIPLQDVEEEAERDEDDSKDSKEPDKQHSFFQTPVHPLRIQKRTPRGARPLPPNPVDVQSRSRPGPLREERELQDHEVIFSPPPPFTAVGPSLDGPSYEQSMHHVSGSAALSSLSTPNHTSFHSSPVHWAQQRPCSSYSPAAQQHTDSYRRISHNPYFERSSSSPSENISTVNRLKFDPSIAYGTSSNMHDLWERPSDSTSVNAASLYSSAVSSYLHPASTGNPGPRSSYIHGARSRYSTSPRPSSSSSMLTHASGPVAPALRFHSHFSASHQSLPPPDHVRWATSEAEFTRDIYP